MLCSSEWKFLNKSTKGEHIIKHPFGKKPTAMVASGNESEENTPHVLTPRMAALASARQKM